MGEGDFRRGGKGRAVSARGRQRSGAPILDMAYARAAAKAEAINGWAARQYPQHGLPNGPALRVEPLCEPPEPPRPVVDLDQVQGASGSTRRPTRTRATRRSDRCSQSTMSSTGSSCSPGASYGIISSELLRSPTFLRAPHHHYGRSPGSYLQSALKLSGLA